MPCSAITLSLATICAVVSVALLAIAFGTDNWQYIKVNRVEIEVSHIINKYLPTPVSPPTRYKTNTRIKGILVNFR